MIKLPIAALLLVVALLGGFYGGYKVGGGGGTAAAATTTGTGNAALGRGLAAACPTPNAPAAAPTAAPSGRTAARRGTNGTVTNLTTSSLTVHDARCGTDVKVTFDPSVIVRKTAIGTVSDLQESQTVTVVGTRQADGSVKANSIQIVPAGGAGGFGGGATAGG
ncbi:MAG: hypothetical protein M3077_06220 [Candidatus Dormibacteraeota bacterium]|nr:hypothetical protein [Candidatus Dormibacteraeota bacterium]